MKKMLAAFALVALIVLPFSAFAAGLDESPLYGTYIRAVEYNDGQYYITLFHLFSDHTGFYMSEWVSDGKMEGAHEEMITWMFTKEAKVQIALKAGVLEYSMGNYGQLKDSSGFIFTKVYPRRDWN